ncbi:MAG: restriction endonuclease subunit S [Microthrixaceae bacterium]
MDAQTFLDNFATIAEAPGGIQRLRDLVLELAVSGQLVEQMPSDEPASQLLHRIHEARQRLVDGGILGRPKRPPKISFEDETLPGGWTLAPLSSAVTWDLTDGDWVESKDQDPSGAVRLIQLADVGVGDFKDKSARYLTQETSERLNCTPLEPGDVLIARLPNPLGRACVFPGLDQACVTVVDIAIARCSPVGMDPAYLALFMNSPAMRSRVEAVAAGTTRKRVSTGNLRAIPISLPPLAEQQRIVAKVDELRGLCDKLEARQEHRHRVTMHFRSSALHALTEAETPDDLRHAWERIHASWVNLFDSTDGTEALREAVLDLATTGQFGIGTADQWTRCQLGDQITLQRGFDITKSQQRPGPYPVVSSGGVFSHHDQAACSGPGVVIGRKGSVGRVHWIPEDYWPHDTTLWVKDFHGNDPEYVYWFLRSFPLLDYESSTANPSLNRNRLHPVEIVWPDRSLQGDLVRYLRKILALCAQADDRLRRSDVVSTSLAASATHALTWSVLPARGITVP